MDDTDPALNLTAINVVLHLGTLLTILVFYRKRILTLIKSERRTLALLVAGTLPAVIVGLPLKLFLEESLTEPLLAGFLLIGTGTLLVSTSRVRERDQSLDTLTYRNAILIGMGQALAILPGLSRSGTTISVALFVGVKRQASAEFSFLLAIPAIAGAGLLEAKDLLQTSPTSTAVGLFGTRRSRRIHCGNACIAMVTKVAGNRTSGLVCVVVHSIRSGRCRLASLTCSHVDHNHYGRDAAARANQMSGSMASHTQQQAYADDTQHQIA